MTLLNHPRLHTIADMDSRWLAVVISCLLSWLNILSNPVMNNDAFGYLRAAELFIESGIEPVLSEYGWYAYSILIAFVHQTLPLSLVNSAHLLNMIFHGILVYSFITLVAEYRASKQVQWYATLVILTFPLVNEIRNFLIRDFAYWAFAMAALVQLIRYHRHHAIKHALAWCLTMFAAILFRLEGLLLLVITPISLLCGPHLDRTTKVGNYLRLQGLLVAAAVLVLLICQALGISLLALMSFAYRYYLPGIVDIGTGFREQISNLNAAIFSASNFPGDSLHGAPILIVGYLYVTLANLVIALNLPLTLLLLHGAWNNRFKLPEHAAMPLAVTTLTSLITLLAFLSLMSFLTQRYATFTALCLLSLAPLCLDTLADQCRAAGRQLRYYVVLAIFVIYFLVDSLVSFGTSKAYLMEAADWMRGNLPQEITLHTNDMAMAHGSGRVREYDKISLEAADAIAAMTADDYLALKINRNENQLRQTLDQREDLILLQRFSNNRNDEARIYQVWR